MLRRILAIVATGILLAGLSRAQTDCDPLDVYIVMDKSLSISNADKTCVEQTGETCWVQISSWAREFYVELKTVTGGLYDGGACTGLRIALLIYSTLGSVALPITGDEAEIEEGFERLKNVTVFGGTDPAEAFRRVIELQNGDALTKSRPQSLVYLTDGRNQANAALKTNSGKYRTTACKNCRKPIGTGSKRCIKEDFTDACVLQSGIKSDRTKQAVSTSTTLRGGDRKTQMFGVGVGDQIDFNELEKITGSADNVFTAKDTNSIQDIVAPLAARTLNLFKVSYASKSSVNGADPPCVSVKDGVSVRVTGRSVVHLEGRSMKCVLSGVDGIPDATVAAETTYDDNGNVKYLSCTNPGVEKLFWPWEKSFKTTLYIETNAGTGVEDKLIGEFDVLPSAAWCFGGPTHANNGYGCFGTSSKIEFNGPSLTSELQSLVKNQWSCDFDNGAHVTPAVYTSANSLVCEYNYPVSTTALKVIPSSLRISGSVTNSPSPSESFDFKDVSLAGGGDALKPCVHLSSASSKFCWRETPKFFVSDQTGDAWSTTFSGVEWTCEYNGVESPAERDGERVRCVLPSELTSHNGVQERKSVDVRLVAKKGAQTLYDSTLPASFTVDPCLDIVEPPGGVKSSVCGEVLEFALTGNALKYISLTDLECAFSASILGGGNKTVSVPPEKKGGSTKCVSPAAIGNYLGWNFDKLTLFMKGGVPLKIKNIVPNEAQKKCIDMQPSSAKFCVADPEASRIIVTGDAVKNFVDAGIKLKCIIDGDEIDAVQSADGVVGCALNEEQTGTIAREVILVMSSSTVGDLEVLKKSIDVTYDFCVSFEPPAASSSSRCIGAPIDSGTIVGKSAQSILGKPVECIFEFESSDAGTKVTFNGSLSSSSLGKGQRCLLSDVSKLLRVVNDDGDVSSGAVVLQSDGVDLVRIPLSSASTRKQESCATFSFLAAPTCEENPESLRTSVSVSGETLNHAHKKMDVKCVFVDEIGKIISTSQFENSACTLQEDTGEAKALHLQFVSLGDNLEQTIAQPFSSISCPDEGSSVGAIVGAIAGVGFVGAALFVAVRKRRKHQRLEVTEAMVSYVGDLTDQFPGKNQEMPQWNARPPQKHKRVDSEMARNVDAAMYGGADNRAELGAMNPGVNRRAAEIKGRKGARASEVDRAMYQGNTGDAGNFGNPLRQKRKEMMLKGEMSTRVGDALYGHDEEGGETSNPMRPGEKRKHLKELGQLSDAVSKSMFHQGDDSMHMYSNPSERKLQKGSGSNRDAVGEALFGGAGGKPDLSSTGTSFKNPAFR